MTTIHVQRLGDHALLSESELAELVALAQHTTEITVQLQDEVLSPQHLMRLLEAGGAFDFWHDAAEDIYTAQDGEPL